jgi:hypothetical protein
MSSNEEAFQRTLLETAEKALVEVLGEKVTTALRFYVDLKSALRNPDRFVAVMFDLVGPRQAESLGERILEGLLNKYGVTYRPSGASLSEQIAKLRSQVT